MREKTYDARFMALNVDLDQVKVFFNERLLKKTLTFKFFTKNANA